MVIAIIGIIMAFVVPAVNGFGRSAALTSAGNLVTNLANYARQDAVSKNTMTALVVLGSQGTDQDFRAVAMVEYDPVAGWNQVGNWELFPAGIIIDRNDATNCSFLANSPQPFPFLSRGGGQKNPPVTYQGKQVTDQTGYAARIFLSNGALQNPDKAGATAPRRRLPARNSGRLYQPRQERQSGQLLRHCHRRHDRHDQSEPPMKKRTFSSSTGGFSLVEVVLAIGVAVFALVSVLGLLNSAANTESNAGRDTVLASMSGYVFSEMRSVPFDALWAADPTTVTNPAPSTASPSDGTYYFTSEGAPVAAANAAQNFDVAYICTVKKTPDSLTQNMDSGNYNQLRVQLIFSWPVNGTQTVQKPGTKSIYASIARN